MKSIKLLLNALLVCLLIASVFRVHTKAQQSPPARHNAQIEVNTSHKNSDIGRVYLVGYSCSGKAIKRAIVTTNDVHKMNEGVINQLERDLEGNFCRDARIFTFQRLDS